MTIITEIIDSFDTFCDFLDYDPKRCMFFDIETTGLSSSCAMVFLIGTIHLDESGNWILTQYLADTCEDESDLLKQFLDSARNFDQLIHFNGTTFDLPFVKDRAKKYQISHALEQMHSLDLYQKFRPLKKLYQLARMNQTSLETFLGWEREDRLTGKHMISLYQAYATSGEEKVRDLLLLHNHDDMLGMTKLLGLTAVLMLLECEIDSVTKAEVVEVKDVPDNGIGADAAAKTGPDGEICVEDAAKAGTDDGMKPEDAAKAGTDSRMNPENATNDSMDAIMEMASCAQSLHLHFHLKKEIPVPLTLCKEISSGISIALSVHGKHCMLNVPLLQGELKYFFKDYKNYFYLPLEDQAIHKSVGAFVDKDLRQLAKPATCYIRKWGTFLPQPELLFEPAFRIYYQDKLTYFEYNEQLFEDSEQPFTYVQNMLSLLF